MNKIRRENSKDKTYNDQKTNIRIQNMTLEQRPRKKCCVSD